MSLPEYCVVKLKCDAIANLTADYRPHTFLKGTIGTVIEIYNKGEAYEIEINEPVWGLAVLLEKDLEVIWTLENGWLNGNNS